MTLTEFRRNATEFFVNHQPSLRYGQATMVYLNGVNTTLYNNVPDWANPFYDDKKVEMFYQHLEEVWDSYETVTVTAPIAS